MALLERFPALIWRSGLDAGCTYFNHTWLEFTGRSLEQELGHGWTASIHPDDFDRCIAGYLGHFAARTPIEMEYRLRRHDGEYRWLIDTGQPIHDEAGEFTGYIGFCLDITARRNTEAELRERETRMRTLLASMGEGVIVRDANGLLQLHNAAAAAILGVSDAEMSLLDCRADLLSYLDEDGEPIARSQIPPMRALETGKPTAGMIGVDRQDGSRRWLWTNAIPLFEDESNALRGVVTTIADVTVRRNHEEQLQLAWTVFSNSVEAIIVTDAQERILSVNRAFTDVTGYTEEEAIGKTPRMLRSGHHDKGFYDLMWQEIGTLGFWQGEIHDRRKNGTMYPAALSISAVHDKGGRITHYVAVFSDITERKASEARIAFLAQHDPLTGLPNRTLLHDRLEQALAHAARHGKRIALMFLDLDRFKTINDSLGHMMGDRLLQGVAQRLTHCIRETDTVSRQGGDEFLIVLTDIETPDDAARVAEKILARLGPTFEIDNQQLGTSFSIGIALYPEDGDNVETLMKNADTAMYHAKESGRNTYRFFDEVMNINALERLHLENGLRRALEQNEFTLHYQPQVDLASGRIIGVEALLRWFSGVMGGVSPARFIPLAEECGLIVPIGEWVMQTACRQARAWQDQGFPPMPVAVNLSAMQFRRTDIVATVAQALTDSGLDGTWLELELTESLLMQSGPDVEAILGRLKALGVRLSIDDFGTGYSSLAYLKRFPVDRLKIDQSFVRDIAEDPDDAAIVRAVIQLGHSLRLEVIAEGTETPEQMDFLRNEGCSAAQGYLFSPPLPADAVTELLRIGILPAAPILAS
ncbi:MAG TPA: EAL domain-containing protein [Zoogloea sp.]|uniref:sensor domain-containing protein n=1 Tax=Zoogloea sp. TaxID=49181 RepID=UPI002BCAB2AD|nr:EAL domain-containing protein [Zoogloea sp.]HOB45865.1 EAL domain-containing protein [Zoogloea sp.]HQA11217.1 EAL domain-containing protein [Zoogloea sp.]